MSKELEALERIGNKLATGGAVINQTFDFEIIKQALTELETLKSQNRNAYKEGYEQGKFDASMEETPTAVEICKALSEYWGYEWKTVYELMGDRQIEQQEHQKYMFDSVIAFNCSFPMRSKYAPSINLFKGGVEGIENYPPHLIPPIGKFYEKEVGK